MSKVNDMEALTEMARLINENARLSDLNGELLSALKGVMPWLNTDDVDHIFGLRSYHEAKSSALKAIQRASK